MKLHFKFNAESGRNGFAKQNLLRSSAVIAALSMAPLAYGQVGAQTASAAGAAPAAPVRVGVNLNITPKRLTFNRGQRSASVYIFNQGTSPATFDIALVDRVMLPNGDIRPASEAQSNPEAKPFVERLKSAQGMLLATPRRATLAPGKGQTIRIRLTPSAAAAATEHRSHLTVTTVPPRNVGLTADNAATTAPDQFSFRITSVFGLSIPVIVRSGAADANGEIRNARLGVAELSPDGVAPPKRTPVLSFDIARTGANSLFGNVEVRAKGREKDPIGLVRGLGIYTEIDHRTVQIPLQRAPARGEQLEIVFIDDDQNPGRIISRSSLTAP